MQIFLHQLDGSSTVATINQNDSLEAFLINNSLNGFRLVCQGTILSQDNLSSTLFENANVYLTSDLDGGKKKKKKKVYTTKKKNKHIHKKIPGLTLSLYSVDGNFLLIQARVMSLKPERPAHHVVQESSWPNIGTDITVDCVTPPLRWTHKPSKRTNKS